MERIRATSTLPNSDLSFAYLCCSCLGTKKQDLMIRAALTQMTYTWESEKGLLYIAVLPYQEVWPCPLVPLHSSNALLVGAWYR